MCNDEYVPKYANDPVKLARLTRSVDQATLERLCARLLASKEQGGARIDE